MTQTVFVIDDDDAARSSLTFLFRAEGLMSRSFPSARAFLDQLSPDHRGCVVTDVRMPGMDGLSLVEALRDRRCAMPVVVITGHADVQLAVRAMKAGVVDFIEKPFDADVILKAVGFALDQDRVKEGLNAGRSQIAQRRASLTSREAEVLAQVVDGWSNKEIANTLGISPRTVEIHRANVMMKMQAGSLSELVRMAMTIAA